MSGTERLERRLRLRRQAKKMQDKSAMARMGSRTAATRADLDIECTCAPAFSGNGFWPIEVLPKDAEVEEAEVDVSVENELAVTGFPIWFPEETVFGLFAGMIEETEEEAKETPEEERGVETGEETGAETEEEMAEGTEEETEEYMDEGGVVGLVVSEL
ncbi:hypothetical protein LTR28_007924 [Elasticomyces elasticus]|nr:hypothetical protein LTR28_007924 [Elasticomyces elasticus]